jgi:membrane protease YdiL (CAAX protease family)
MNRRRVAALAIAIGVLMALTAGGSVAFRAGVGVGWALAVLVAVALVRGGRGALARLRERFLSTAAGEDRGLASAFIGFFLILIVAALMYTLLDPAMAEIVNHALANSPNQQATDAINRREEIWSNILYFILFLAAIFIIGNAVFESQRPG